MNPHTMTDKQFGCVDEQVYYLTILPDVLILWVSRPTDAHKCMLECFYIAWATIITKAIEHQGYE